MDIDLPVGRGRRLARSAGAMCARRWKPQWTCSSLGRNHVDVGVVLVLIMELEGASDGS